eukprot:256411-Amphidinium_carterae.1
MLGKGQHGIEHCKNGHMATLGHMLGLTPHQELSPRTLICAHAAKCWDRRRWALCDTAGCASLGGHPNIVS